MVHLHRLVSYLVYFIFFSDIRRCETNASASLLQHTKCYGEIFHYCIFRILRVSKAFCFGQFNMV